MRKWLHAGGKAKIERAKKWLGANSYSIHTLIHLLHGESLELERKKFVAELHIR
jgi:hypothetical protein